MLVTILKYSLCCLAAVTLTVVMPVAPPKLILASQTTTDDGPCTGPFRSFAEKFEFERSKWDMKKTEGFKLIQCYPEKEHQLTEKDFPWYDMKKGGKLDFRDEAEWKDYLGATLRYCFEGGALSAEVPQKKSEARWFHTPWLHSGGTGREPIHGLTYERVSEPRELSLTQEMRVQNWAVGLYNAPGGYVIGRVWKTPNCPDPRAARFPPGTVAIKLLFTEASIGQAPYLGGQGEHEWEAYIYEELPKDPKRPDPEAPRKIQRLRLLQIDLAMRDDRAEGTGWVFGTYVYDKDNNNGAYPGCDINKNPWCRVVPIGLMWGNDPGAMQNGKIQESKFNELEKLPKELMDARKGKIEPGKRGLGWGGRLNGPVNNPESSCLSCHATSSWPQFERVPLNDLRTEKKMHWFRNFKVIGKNSESFWPGTETLDYSLQLSAGIRNFYQIHDGDFDCNPEAKRKHGTLKSRPLQEVMRDSDP